MTTTLAAQVPTPEAPCPRCRNSLVMPDGRRACLRHRSRAELDLIAALDERAADAGLPPSSRPEGGWVWPYGAGINVATRERMLDWAASEGGLRLAPNAHECLTWLLRGRCTATTCSGDLRRRSTPLGTTGSWADHLTTWKRDGRAAVIVAQPYVLEAPDLQELAWIERDERLRVEVQPDGWYGHGARFVAIWQVAA
ncbi:hypothetical protein [Pimelobacter simplex]|uniref:hypothetical protein n=1 Tax=Nocardioides simplex TaxID=2045 RepID=UPI003AAE634B